MPMRSESVSIRSRVPYLHVPCDARVVVCVRRRPRWISSAHARIWQVLMGGCSPRQVICAICPPSPAPTPAATISSTSRTRPSALCGPRWCRRSDPQYPSRDLCLFSFISSHAHAAPARPLQLLHRGGPQEDGRDGTNAIRTPDPLVSLVSLRRSTLRSPPTRSTTTMRARTLRRCSRPRAAMRPRSWTTGSRTTTATSRR